MTFVDGNRDHSNEVAHGTTSIHLPQEIMEMILFELGLENMPFAFLIDKRLYRTYNNKQFLVKLFVDYYGERFILCELFEPIETEPEKFVLLRFVRKLLRQRFDLLNSLLDRAMNFAKRGREEMMHMWNTIRYIEHRYVERRDWKHSSSARADSIAETKMLATIWSHPIVNLVESVAVSRTLVGSESYSGSLKEFAKLSMPEERIFRDCFRTPKNAKCFDEMLKTRKRFSKQKESCIQNTYGCFNRNMFGYFEFREKLGRDASELYRTDALGIVVTERRTWMKFGSASMDNLRKALNAVSFQSYLEDGECDEGTMHSLLFVYDRDKVEHWGFYLKNIYVPFLLWRSSCTEDKARNFRKNAYSIDEVFPLQNFDKNLKQRLDVLYAVSLDYRFSSIGRELVPKENKIVNFVNDELDYSLPDDVSMDVESWMADKLRQDEFAHLQTILTYWKESWCTSKSTFNLRSYKYFLTDTIYPDESLKDRLDFLNLKRRAVEKLLQETTGLDRVKWNKAVASVEATVRDFYRVGE